MIPADLANTLKLVITEKPAPQQQLQSLAPAQKISDVLSDLIPGQRIMAEIQALLPNGAYRAVVAQRDVTLALPFTAKPGDSLELEVVENEGKIALAVVANRSGNSATASDSVSTSLSNTGKLIGELMSKVDEREGRSPAASLNRSEPLVETMPKTATALVPLLKQALSESGMFYEAHQARWVAGEFPTEALKQEPQGKYPAVQISDQNTSKTLSPGNPEQSITTPSTKESAAGNLVPRDLMPIVQQQLDGLANQNFAWQGQIWPGQQMRWEIGENMDDSRSSNTEEIQRWQTRLKLSLPLLGDIDVALNLKTGGEVSIVVTATSESSEARLHDEAMQLHQQFEAAGLSLTDLQVLHGEATE